MPVINVNGWLLTVPRYRGPSYAERKEQRMQDHAIAERREYLRKRWIFASAQAEKYANISRSRVRQRDYASAKFYQHQAAQWAWEAHRLQASWAVCKFGVTMSKIVERGEYGAFDHTPRFVASMGPYKPDYIVGEGG